MARRPGDDGPGLDLSPRARRIAGWVIAILIVVGIAVAVSLFGGDADEVANRPSASASASTDVDAITFGTEIDPVTGEVATESVTDTFGRGDSFAYSVRPAEPPPSPIFVEVRRIAGGPIETVQPPSMQLLPAGAEVAAFVVPAGDLVDDFGGGDYVMRIYAEVGGELIAQGEFSVVADPSSASPSP